MRCLRTLSVLTVTLSLVWSMTIETTSSRTKPEPTTPNSTKLVPLETNATSSSVGFLDVRTPPKIQSFIKDKLANKTIEQSHAGIAIPLDEEDILDESTKKMNFYKLDRPTTNPGLSTWILLSGQTSTKPTTTKKPSIKPIILKDEKNNETLMLSEKPMKIVKPAFKQRSTTAKPISTSSIRSTTVKASPKNATRKPLKPITKVKASLLQNIGNNATTSTTAPISTTTTVATTTTTVKIATNSSSLPVEAKNDEQELPGDKKKKKKKKNKRRNKPEKKDSSIKLKESPGTQLYSYLRSEIIPVTVGFSLVGLLVTAGLASYYLQPFAALRRQDQVDRKDTEANYYYHDQYSNAVPEEEAIGKVIAGMPESSLQPNKQNVRYRHVDRRSQIHMNPFGSVEDVQLSDRPQSDKFVVGNVPKEVTPAVVPEHGPRNLKEQKFVVGNVPKEYLYNGSPRYLRRRRQVVMEQDDAENEIIHYDEEAYTKSTTILPNIDASTTTKPQTQRPSTLFELLTDLFRLKVRLGLELMQNVTQSVSSYVTRVHSRLDEHYRTTRPNSNNTIS